MALSLIMGKAGSGKSTFLYEKIIEEAEKNPKQTYLVLVPEQFTLSTQQEFVARTKSHCIMNIDVLSFERLAYRVFDELGITDLTVLEDIGKSLIIRKIAKEKETQLMILRKNIDKPGYLDQVKSLLTEFAQYHVTVEKMQQVLDEMSQSLLYYKMHDLMLLYEGMEEFIKDSYITAEKLLLMLSDVAEKSKLLKNAVVAFDGYTGFTPVQSIFLETLMPMVKQIYVTVLIDPKEDWATVGPVHELFYLSKKFIKTLTRIATKANVEVAEPFLMEEPKNRRFKGKMGLSALENNLFRSGFTEMKASSDDVKIVHLDNPRKELSYVASLVYRFQKQGMRYHEMAIVTADMETYAGVIGEVFDTARIPYFVDQKKKITFNSFAEMIKGLMDMVDEDFSYESVFRYLKTGLSNISNEEIEQLENFCLSTRLRGYKKYNLPFAYNGTGYSQEEIDQLNDIRERFMEPLTIWCTIAREKATAREYCQGLLDVLHKLELEERLAEFADRLEEVGQKQRSREYRQIYKHVEELLEKYVALLGSEDMALSEFKEILEAGLDATKVATIPAGRDCIILGDIERTRLEHIKVLFFVGVNEGVIPRISTGSMCLTQTERELLMDREMELAAGPKERIFIQQFYLYMIMAKAKERLYITYADHTMSGEAIKPSYLIGNVQEILTSIEIEDGSDISYEEENFCEGLAFSHMVETIATDEAREVIAYFAEKPEYKERFEQLKKAVAGEQQLEQLEQSLIEALYSKEMTGSVTRLECVAKCSLQHFLSYGLKLQERDTGKFTMLDMGTIFHKAMEEYSIELKRKGYTYASVPYTMREELAEVVVRNAISDLNQVYLYDNARNRYQMERLIRIVKRGVWVLGKQMEKSKFEPVSFEKKFKLTKAEENEMLALGDGFSMELTGKIDRIDMKKQEDKLYYRVVDYKSGNTKLDLGQVYDGTQLQLMTYQNAARQELETKYKDAELCCDGAYYYSMKDPFIKEKGVMTQEAIDEALLDELRLDGAGSDMEDDSTTKKSKSYGQETLTLLEEYTKHKINELGKEIVKGQIKANPREIGDVLGCDYCRYNSYCGFDKGMDKADIRRSAKASEDVLLEMAERLKREE